MQTAAALTLFVAALATPSACGLRTTPEATATETALCDVWEDSLPSRSRADTLTTQREIGRLYDVFEAVCERRVPPRPAGALESEG